ncbi:MAG: endonuclease III [Thermodesulfobacteriota bacterium]
MDKTTSPPPPGLALLAQLDALYPEARIALHFGSPLELLVATMLSAQCTDEVVNRVTPALFARYRTAADFAAAPQAELEKAIYSTGFFRNKAKHLRASCQLLVDAFGGQVPKTMEEMLRLPGVSRKTANIVLANAYGVVVGIPVDTHVKRLAGRLGLSAARQPERIEADLMALVPRKDWGRVSYALIAHGRALCLARKPRCAQCPLAPTCPSAFKV